MVSWFHPEPSPGVLSVIFPSNKGANKNPWRGFCQERFHIPWILSRIHPRGSSENSFILWNKELLTKVLQGLQQPCLGFCPESLHLLRVLTRTYLGGLYQEPLCTLIFSSRNHTGYWKGFYIPNVLSRTHPGLSSKNPFIFQVFYLEPVWRVLPITQHKGLYLEPSVKGFYREPFYGLMVLPRTLSAGSIWNLSTF